MCLAPLAHGALLDALLRVGDVDDTLHENAGRVNLIRVDLAGGHEMLDLGHRDLAGARHHRVEIARRLSVDEIALAVALPGVDEAYVGDEAPLHDVGLAVKLPRLFALGDNGADASLGEEGGDAGAAGADALGERALRREFELELAGEIEVGKSLVLADI